MPFITASIPTTYTAPILHHSRAGAKVAQLIYLELFLRHFCASQYFFKKKSKWRSARHSVCMFCATLIFF